MSMLNTIAPAYGATKNSVRVGRGMGSKGKTCGRGHKGQKSRSGGYVPVGFEGGQNPLHRRLPKRGFTSRISKFSAQLRTSELNKLTVKQAESVTVDVLKEAGLINKHIIQVKIFASGEVKLKANIKGIVVSSGAKAAIEKAGGKVED